MTVRHLLEQCDADREAEVTRRQQTDERLRQVLEANRVLTAQLQQGGYDSPAVQQQVRFLSDEIRRFSCSLTRAMDGRIVRCGIISSCQSAATSEIVKRFWSRV